MNIQDSLISEFVICSIPTTDILAMNNLYDRMRHLSYDIEKWIISPDTYTDADKKARIAKVPSAYANKFAIWAEKFAVKRMKKMQKHLRKRNVVESLSDSDVESTVKKQKKVKTQKMSEDLQAACCAPQQKLKPPRNQ